LKIDLVRTGEAVDGCCTLRLSPHPWSLGEIRLVDCTLPDGQAKAVDDCDLWLGGSSTCVIVHPPSDPLPADGAVDVSVDVALDCAIHRAAFSPRCAVLGADRLSVYFGTDPDPPLLGHGWPLPFDPGVLLPAATYHWRVVYYDDAYAPPVSSPVWSFTTAAVPNPVEASTWGRIKAFYRR
jgi:hypothetical protein